MTQKRKDIVPKGKYCYTENWIKRCNKLRGVFDSPMCVRHRVRCRYARQTGFKILKCTKCREESK